MVLQTFCLTFNIFNCPKDESYYIVLIYRFHGLNVKSVFMQIHEEAKKFSYLTGVKVVVAYGGAPISLQVWEMIIAFIPHFNCIF